jgi:hypothetical protein
MGDGRVSDPDHRVRPFLDPEDSSRHDLGRRLVPAYAAHPRADWNEPGVASFRGLGAAQRQVVIGEVLSCQN